MKNPKNTSVQGKNFSGFYLVFDEDGFYNIQTDPDKPNFMIMNIRQFYNLAQEGRNLPSFEEFVKEEFGMEFYED